MKIKVETGYSEKVRSDDKQKDSERVQIHNKIKKVSTTAIHVSGSQKDQHNLTTHNQKEWFVSPSHQRFSNHHPNHPNMAHP